MMRKKGILLLAALTLGLLFPGSAMSAKAASTSYTVEVTGHYQHPVTGTIEDSGGESSLALGQSMVDSVVDTTGLLIGSDADGYELYVRFHLMNNISEVSLQVQEPGDSDWDSITTIQTAQGDDTGDFYIPIPGQDAIVRAQCYVTAMGRSVIFYITADNAVEGNTTDLAEYTGTTVTTTTSSSSDDVTGLTVGYGSGSSSTDTSTDSAASSDTAAASSGSGFTLDDSFWMVLFGIIFCAMLLAGLVLILIVALILFIIKNRKPSMEEDDDEEEEEDDEDDDLNLDFDDDEED